VKITRFVGPGLNLLLFQKILKFTPIQFLYSVNCTHTSAIMFKLPEKEEVYRKKENKILQA